jgi:hypothetical protein
MKKTSLFPYGNSRTGKSGRRREESGRTKSREGTTEVGEMCVFCYKELRSRKMKRNEKDVTSYSRTEIAVPTSLDAGEKKAGGRRAGRVPPRLGKQGWIVAT